MGKIGEILIKGALYGTIAYVLSKKIMDKGYSATASFLGMNFTLKKNPDDQS